MRVPGNKHVRFERLHQQTKPLHPEQHPEAAPFTPVWADGGLTAPPLRPKVYSSSWYLLGGVGEKRALCIQELRLHRFHNPSNRERGTDGQRRNYRVYARAPGGASGRPVRSAGCPVGHERLHAERERRRRSGLHVSFTFHTDAAGRHGDTGGHAEPNRLSCTGLVLIKERQLYVQRVHTDLVGKVSARAIKAKIKTCTGQSARGEEGLRTATVQPANRREGLTTNTLQSAHVCNKNMDTMGIHQQFITQKLRQVNITQGGRAEVVLQSVNKGAGLKSELLRNIPR